MRALAILVAAAALALLPIASSAITSVDVTNSKNEVQVCVAFLSKWQLGSWQVTAITNHN